MKNKITALYCRVSKEDRYGDSSSSINTQKHFLIRYAYSNNFKNTKLYIDDGVSGTNFKRPGFNRLKNDIENGLVSNVLTKDLSRLGRNYLLTGKYIEHYFPLYNIRYIAINDQVDTFTNTNDFAPFKNIMNEWYAKDISKKVRSAYKTKALKGEFTGAFAPYGYVKSPSNKNQLIINKESSEIIIKIYNLYLEGNSINKIASILTNDKILTPRAFSYKMYNVYKKNQNNIKWSSNTVSSILKNEVYIGTIISGKHKTKSFKDKTLVTTPKSNWIYVKNKHQSIICDNTFNKVQKLLHTKNIKKNSNSQNIFKGTVKCGDCDKTMTLTKTANRNSYGNYTCNTYKKQGKTSCEMHYITYEYLYSKTMKEINKMIKLSKQGLIKFQQQIITKNNYTKKSKTENKKLINIEKRINSINKNTIIAFEYLISNKITEEKHTELETIYSQEKQKLLNQKQEIENTLSQIEHNINGIPLLHKKLIKYNNLEKLTNEQINDIIKTIIVKNEKDKNNKRLFTINYKHIGVF